LATPRLWIGAAEVSIESDCDYWVVFDMPAHATCVEPQSATPDAFNLAGNLAGNLGGAVRLEPGEELRRAMTIAWTQSSTHPAT
jgi:aldose 1-epimerase